jgi:hypothetical protein
VVANKEKEIKMMIVFSFNLTLIQCLFNVFNSFVWIVEIKRCFGLACNTPSGFRNKEGSGCPNLSLFESIVEFANSTSFSVAAIKALNSTFNVHDTANKTIRSKDNTFVSPVPQYKGC